MEQLADRLHVAADELAAADRSMSALTVPAGVFAADDAGLPGRVGRQLHAHWSAVLTARAHEAADAAARLTDLAEAIRETKRDYAETDESVGRNVERTGR